MLNLFDKEQDAELETLKEEATQTTQATVDPVVEQERVVTESVEKDEDPSMWGGYMNELGKY